MRKSIMFGMVSLATVTLLCGCDDFGENRGKGQGRIVPLIGLDSDLLGSGTKIGPESRADGTTGGSISVNDLSVTLEKTEGNYMKTWESVDAFVADCETSRFTVGEYKLSVAYGDQETTGFDVPAYYGSSILTVKDDQASEVGVSASMSKAMFSFTYTEAFTKYMADWSIEVGGVTVGKDETRPAYVLPGETGVKMTFTTVAGQTATATVATVEAAAKHHYKVAVDVNGGEVGDAVLKVDWDETLETEIVEIKLEGLFNSEPPTIVADGFEADKPISFVEGFAPESPLKLNIVAMGGLKSVLLETTSNGLSGWPASVELLGADAATQQTLTDKGFAVRGLWRNPDKMAQIDFAGVLKYIKTSPEGNTTEFKVTVEDNYGRSESMALTVEAEGLILNLDPNNEAFYTPGEPVVFTMEYNGLEPKKNIELTYISADVTRPRPVADWTVEPLSRAANLYQVSMNGFKTNSHLEITAKCNGQTASTTIKAPRYIVTAEDNNVFATYAYVSVYDNETKSAADLSSLTFGATVNGAEITVGGAPEGKLYKVTGLTPAQVNKIRVISDERSSVAAVNTEAATQLPNSGMEEWYSEKAPHSQTTGFGMDAYRWFANAQGKSDWATRNALTTATNNGPTPYYVSFSGTVNTTGVTGNAAEISTIGYGEGSTFVTGGGICKHTAAGMLFIGEHSAENETAETIKYGMKFESRPSALKFKYKFAPYEGESFKAYIVVENRDGETVRELGRGELVSGTEVTSFSEATVDVKYTDISVKATHAYVVFLSSTSENPAVKNVKGSKGAFGGYADSKRIGNVLTVDDIELIY